MEADDEATETPQRLSKEQVHEIVDALKRLNGQRRRTADLLRQSERNAK